MATITHKLMQGETELMRGDEKSISVIFGNLTGVNFDRRQADYAPYLEYMRHELDYDIQPAALRIDHIEGNQAKKGQA